jgi:hypothetical protein
MQIEMPSKWRVNSAVNEEVFKKLEAWAAQENRSISSLVGTILREAVASHDLGIYEHSQRFPDTAIDKKEKGNK